MGHLIAHWLGIDNETGPVYAFWSGFGGDVAIVGGLLASPAVYWRHHNCHEPRCLRIGHPVEGVVKCRRHRRG